MQRGDLDVIVKLHLKAKHVSESLFQTLQDVLFEEIPSFMFLIFITVHICSLGYGIHVAKIKR